MLLLAVPAAVALVAMMVSTPSFVVDMVVTVAGSSFDHFSSQWFSLGFISLFFRFFFISFYSSLEMLLNMFHLDCQRTINWANIVST